MLDKICRWPEKEGVGLHPSRGQRSVAKTGTRVGGQDDMDRERERVQFTVILNTQTRSSSSFITRPFNSFGQTSAILPQWAAFAPQVGTDSH